MRLFGRRREGPGGLPEDGTVELAGIRLRGRRVRSGLQEDGPAVLWRTDGEPEKVFTVFGRLAAAHPRTGLWPVLLTGERLDLDTFDPEWERKLPALDVAARWAEYGSYDEELELGPFPGLAAPGSTAVEDPQEHVFATLDVHSLALVPVQRPADVLGAISWLGAVNQCAAVELVPYLRSWEERFDARLVALGFDTAHLAVGRPPSPEEALKAAAELYMFNPDLVEQGVGSVQALARELAQGPHWAFWWD